MLERFEEWRRQYKDMDYEEQRAFYSWVAKTFPSQVHFDLPGFIGALDRFTWELGEYSVLEVGGWRGELAAEILGRTDQIKEWVNYEIAEPLLDNIKCDDPRYRMVIPDDFVWNIDLFEGDVLVASDMIEHISGDHLALLVENLPDSVKRIAFKSPLGHWTQPNGWVGYYGSHILELGWPDVSALLYRHDFVEAGRSGTVRIWKRDV
jgi:hypothetical protein